MQFVRMDDKLFTNINNVYNQVGKSAAYFQITRFWKTRISRDPKECQTIS